MAFNEDFNTAAAPEKPAYGDLIWAAQMRDEEAVENLLQRGSDVNERTENGETALMWAVRLGEKEIVLMLLEQGALIDMPDTYGYTALHIAENFLQTEMIQILNETKLSRENAKAAAVLAVSGAEKEQARQSATERKLDLLRGHNPRLTIRRAP